MIKRVLGGAAVAIAAAATVLVPAGTANASPVGGSTYCYGIKKSGNYNRLAVEAVASKISGKYAGVARLYVTGGCQRVNSIPITRMYVDKVVIEDGHGRIYAHTGAKHAYSKASLSKATAHHGLPCNTPVAVHAKVSYTYYDRSHVRAFWVHSRTFKRSC